MAEFANCSRASGGFGFGGLGGGLDAEFGLQFVGVGEDLGEFLLEIEFGAGVVVVGEFAEAEFELEIAEVAWPASKKFRHEKNQSEFPSGLERGLKTES